MGTFHQYLEFFFFLFLFFFFKKISPLNSDVWVGGHLAYNFFQSYMLPLFFSGLLSYLVGLKRRTSRLLLARDNSQ